MSERASALAQSLRKHFEGQSGWQQLADDYVALGSVCSSFVSKVQRTCYAVEQIPVEVYAPATHTNRCVLLLHGGHYWLPVVDFYREVAASLAQNSACNVVLVDYAVHPYVYPYALDQVKTVWDWLSRQTANISLVGDGSGAQMALCMARYLRDNDLLRPASLVLVSPWVDLTASGDSYYDNYYLDVVLGRRALGGMDIPHAYRVSPLVSYFAGHDLASPAISPLFGDLSCLPPCYITVGEYEVLYSDAARLYQALQQGGVRSHLAVGNALFHAYPFYLDRCPESKEAFASICAFLQSLPETTALR